MGTLRLNRKAEYMEIPPFPRNMLIEVTNACNQACVFCPQRVQERKIVNGDKNLIFNILEQAYSNGTREVGFYMNGESLLCPELEEYIKKASDEGYEYIYLSTNGVLATVERLKSLEKAGLSSVKISINAATRQTYKHIHGRDDFEKVKENIALWYEMRTRKGEHNKLPILISFVKCEDNAGEVELLYEQFGDMVDDIYVHEADNRVGIMPGKDGKVEISVHPCDMIFNRIHVNSSGFLTACCSDYNGMLTVVDLHETDLKTGWESEPFRQLRRQHLERNIEKNQCFNCLYNVNGKDIMPLNEGLYLKGKKNI